MAARDSMHMPTGCGALMTGFGTVCNGMRSIMSRGSMHCEGVGYRVFHRHYKALWFHGRAPNLSLIFFNLSGRAPAGVHLIPSGMNIFWSALDLNRISFNVRGQEKSKFFELF